jgi:hypothetical protein
MKKKEKKFLLEGSECMLYVQANETLEDKGTT